jgi:DNA-binding transcriptional LysR family regulator
VVLAGNIALAAKGHPDQPNLPGQLSKQISELEKVLGLQLLDRTRKPYPPTPEAWRLAEACGRFVREVTEISGEASGLQRPITVGAG